MAKILLVEDDGDTREILRMALEMDGHAVLETGDGNHALGLMQASPTPLVVLLDLLLNGKGDNPVIKALEADPSLAVAHNVIVLTAVMEDQAEEWIQAIRPSLAGFLPKPFDLSDLLRMVAQVAARTCVAVIPEPIRWDQHLVAHWHQLSLSPVQTHMQIHHLVCQLSCTNTRISHLLHHIALAGYPHL
jgi:CheY-like chemotaxis protein